MEKLFENLERIRELLDQVLTITQNQMIVLLDSRSDPESLDMIEEMANYKQALTIEVEQTEKVFQDQYNFFKDRLKDAQMIEDLQLRVKEVLRLRQAIIEGEQKNVLLLEEAMRRSVEKVQIQKTPSQVVDAYKQYDKEKKTW